MRYFHLSNGLRGCYMPDRAAILAVSSRRELKKAIEYECSDMREAYGFGGSKADIATTVAWVWREWALRHKRQSKGYLPIAIGFGRSRSKNDRPFGVFIEPVSRSEYLEYCRENN